MEPTTKPNQTNEYTKVIALTFDDGPNTTTTVQVLEKLEKYDVTASFFVIGNHINPSTAKVIKRAFSMGCEIANHSQTHSFMNQMEAEAIEKEIQFTSDKILEITGVSPNFFRPPYIAVNDIMYEHINLPFICGHGAEDWVDTVTAQQRAQRILDQVSDGSIILLHDMEGNIKTVDALDILIPKLKEQGYQFVTVSELFKIKGVVPSNHDKITYTNVGHN